jgi:hypothetical protein
MAGLLKLTAQVASIRKGGDCCQSEAESAEGASEASGNSASESGTSASIAEVKTQHEEMDRMRANDRQPSLTEIQKEWVANLAEIGEIQEGIAKTALSIVEVCKSEQKAVWILGRDPAEPREAQLTMRTVFMQMHDAFQRSARMLKPFVQGIHRDADLVTRCCEDTPMSEDIIDCEDTPISEMLEAPNSAPQFQLAPSASQHVAPKPNSASLTAPTPPADSEEMLTAKRACLSGFFG